MKATILDERVKVYSSMDDSLSIATLSKGMEIEFGGAKRKGGKLWVPVVLASGQNGYITGETRIFAIREGTLMQDAVDMHTQPLIGSPILQTLPRSAKVDILEVKKEGDTRWARVRDMSGVEGFIDGETRIHVIPQKTKAMGRRNILTGLMWLIAGGVIAFANSATSFSTAFRLLGILALLFGAGMLVWGIIQMVTAPA